MMPFCDLRPHLTRLFLPAQPRTEFYYFPLHSPSAAPFFSPRNPKRNLIFSLSAYPLVRRAIFHPRKAPKRILFLTLHSPSAAPFSPLKNPKGNFIFNTAYPPHARLFFSPRSPERNFILSLYMHPPSAAARGSRAALQYFRSCRPPFTTRSTGFPYMPNTSNDRARNALRSAETEKFSRPQTLRPPQIGVQGRPYKMNTRKNCIHRRGGRRGIIGRRKWQQEIYYRGLSAGEGVVGVLYMDFRRVKG